MIFEPVEQDRVLDLARLTRQPSPIGRVRTDVRVDDLGARADAHRVRGSASGRPGTGLDHDPALDASTRRRRRRRSSARSVSRIMRLASSMSSFFPVSSHQPVCTCGRTSSPRSIMCWIASVISSSFAERRLDRLRRLEDVVVEQVDADEREIGRRLLRLLDEPDDPVAVEIGDAEGLRDLAPSSAGSKRSGVSRSNSSTSQRRRPRARCPRGTSRTARRAAAPRR